MYPISTGFCSENGYFVVVDCSYYQDSSVKALSEARVSDDMNTCKSCHLNKYSGSLEGLLSVLPT